MSQSIIKLTRSLEHKKYREINQMFVAEGDKTVREILASPMSVNYLLAKREWLEQIPEYLLEKVGEIGEIGEKELLKASFLKTPNMAVALVRIPQNSIDMKEMTGGLSLYLDRVQDPGNVGTIIRLADWFGIRHVLCGNGCADPFHPKTVQSTMGSISRVKIFQTDTSFFKQLDSYQPDFQVYGTFLDGTSLYSTKLSSKAMIVMGNESKGISSGIAKSVKHRLFIPHFPQGTKSSESLNVALAAAIVCAEFRR